MASKAGFDAKTEVKEVIEAFPDAVCGKTSKLFNLIS